LTEVKALEGMLAATKLQDWARGGNSESGSVAVARDVTERVEEELRRASRAST